MLSTLHANITGLLMGFSGVLWCVSATVRLTREALHKGHQRKRLPIAIRPGRACQEQDAVHILSARSFRDRWQQAPKCRWRRCHRQLDLKVMSHLDKPTYDQGICQVIDKIKLLRTGEKVEPLFKKMSANSFSLMDGIARKERQTCQKDACSLAQDRLAAANH